MNLNNLKQNIKIAVKELFTSIDYGDAHRPPLAYISTQTKQVPFRGILPQEVLMQPIKTYQAFPRFSKELLVSLFADIGVHYVPEVALYELQEKRPIEVFQDFVLTFGREDRDGERPIINAKKLNQVIAQLKKMDSLREESLFDSKPIYKLLAKHEFDKASEILDELISIRRMKND